MTGVVSRSILLTSPLGRTTRTSTSYRRLPRAETVHPVANTASSAATSECPSSDDDEEIVVDL